MATVSYTRMADMTEADFALINADADELASFQGALKVSRLELEFFRPIVEEVFSRPRYSADELPEAT